MTTPSTIENDSILILGNGQLGRLLYDTLNYQQKNVTMLNGRIENLRCMGGKYFGHLDDQLMNARVIINTIAVTDTRKCEQDYHATYKVNAEFPLRLINWLKTFGWDSHFVHISSGCIFDGNTTTHFEDAVPTPLINYAQQKLIAEAVSCLSDKVTIVRPRMLFSDLEVPSNLIYKVNRFSEVISEQNSMTCVYDLVDTIDAMIQEQVYGTYNVCNDGMSSPMEIKEMINEVHKRKERIIHISKGVLLERMNGMRLTNTKIGSYTVQLPNVTVRLLDMIENSTWLKN